METPAKVELKKSRQDKIRNFNLTLSILTMGYALVVIIFSNPLPTGLLEAGIVVCILGYINLSAHLLFYGDFWSQSKSFLIYLLQVLLVFLACFLFSGLTSPFIYLLPILILIVPVNINKIRSYLVGLVVLACILTLFFVSFFQGANQSETIKTMLTIVGVSVLTFIFSTLIVQDYFSEEDEKSQLTEKLFRELAQNDDLAKKELEQSKEVQSAEHLSEIYKSIDSLKGVLNYETLVSLIPFSLNTLFKFDQSFLFKEEKGNLVLKSLAVGNADKEKMHLLLDKCIGEERCFREIIDFGQIKEVENIAEELKNSESGSTWVKTEKLTKAVVIPLRIGESLIGCLVAAKKTETGNETLLKDTLGIFATTAVLALENANFYTHARETSQQYNAILTQMVSGVLVTDRDSKLVLLNEAGSKLLGYSQEEVLGKKLSEIIRVFTNLGEKIEDKDNPIFTAGKKVGESFVKEIFLQKKSEDRFPASLSAKSITDEKGSKIGMVIVFGDITKEIEIEKTRNEFISIASHELRTPMTAIKGFLSMVIGNEVGKISPKAKEFLKMAQEGNERLIRLVEDLLNVSRIEGGRIQIQNQEMDLTAVIKVVISDLLYHAGSSGVLINYVSEKGLPKVGADQDKLREVLINLIGNAIKYTNKGGRVTITNELKGWKVITRITDTGIGIPKEEIPNLFKKFYRVPNEMTMKREGTGLGLYITKQIVELMGGELTVESEFKKGSTFSFTLNMAEKDKNIIENKVSVNKTSK